MQAALTNVSLEVLGENHDLQSENEMCEVEEDSMESSCDIES